MIQKDYKIERLSFRDPDGFVIKYNDNFYRIIFRSYELDFENLKKNNLLNHPLLVPHYAISTELHLEIVKVLKDLYDSSLISRIFTILSIKEISFLTYPWEWTSTQLKEAALCTISLQKDLIPLGLTLKDATFYNIQFVGGKPYFIDLLSIKLATKSYPWHPYGQFLKEFVNPLLLIKYKIFPNLRFISGFPDGIDKNEISGLLPFKSRFSIFCLINVFLLKRLSDKNKKNKIYHSDYVVSDSDNKKAFQLLEYVGDFIGDIKTMSKAKKSIWNNYYIDNVSQQYQFNKYTAVLGILESIGPLNRVIDLGANTGVYSKLLSKFSNEVLALEFDETCCEEILKMIHREKINNLQVANVDLVNPAGGVGWMCRERLPLLSRIRGDLVCALAIIHHFFFTNRKSFLDIVDFFSIIVDRFLIVEFIDIKDDKVSIINNFENSINYSMEEFVSTMINSFRLLKTVDVSETRILLFFQKL